MCASSACITFKAPVMLPQVVDMPLLFETKSEWLFSDIIVVTCTPEQQLERLRSRDNLSQAAASSRIRSQLDMSYKAAHGTLIIDNSGSIQDTLIQVHSAGLLLPASCRATCLVTCLTMAPAQNPVPACTCVLDTIMSSWPGCCRLPRFHFSCLVLFLIPLPDCMQSVDCVWMMIACSAVIAFKTSHSQCLLQVHDTVRHLKCKESFWRSVLVRAAILGGVTTVVWMICYY